jgi:phage gpG-like protein
VIVRIVIPTRIGSALKSLEEFPAHVLQAIATTLDDENQLTVGHIVQNRMTGTGPFPPEEGKLGVRSNVLRRSIRASKASIVGSAVVSSIGTNIEYAAIHEFGGVIPPHDIRPRRGKALRFMIGNAVITVGKVRHPGSTIPKRAPIARGIEDRTANYRNAVGAAITSTWDQT